MKNVLILSTAESTGGAAIAASRLLAALQSQHQSVSMMVRDGSSSNPSVHAIPYIWWRKAWERAVILSRNGFFKDKLWQMDIANTGFDLLRHPLYCQTDVIHLHWINQGFLSLRTIREILLSGRRIIWTLHDQWPYTGICHYAGECSRFRSSCQRCPLLHTPGVNDLSHSIFLKKKEVYSSGKITFVGCSRWIAEEARGSALLEGQHIVSIPNPIPSSIFHPMDRAEARRRHRLPQDKPIVMFCSQKVSDERKGFAYLQQALRLLPKVHLLVVGEGGRSVSSPEEMASLYAAADVFVTPSLQDNLPNTIAEAMSVGTPCVGFRVGGIPEMIDHLRNGFVATPRQAESLAEGIRYVLSHDLRSEAAATAAATYNEVSVAQQYMRLYNE